MKKLLGIRTVDQDMTSYGGFKWPESGRVECPDWRDDDQCGGGLHFLMPGHNSPGVWFGNGRWLVVEVEEGAYRSGAGQLVGKAKCKACEVVHCGDRASAMAYLASRGSPGPWYMGIATAGGWGTATAGAGGTATVGARGKATVGAWGIATAGNRGTATAGYGGILQLLYWDGERARIATAYVGEGGIKANVAYKLNDEHKFVEAKDTP